jgi:hypothetical protein
MNSISLEGVTINFLELAVRIGKDIGSKPFCIETGASYTKLPEGNANLIHTTTYNIVWHIAKPNDGVLWSYDNDQTSLDICKNVLGEDVVYWEGILGDSVEQLTQSVFPKPIDFVHFDCPSISEEYMVQEFLAIESYLSPNAVICADDIHNPSSIKWKKAVPLIKTKTKHHIEVSTGLGTFVGFMGDVIGDF